MPGSVGRSIDGGTTWHSFMTGITELRVLDLAQVNNVLYAVTDKGIAKSTDGGELWTYVETGLPSALDKPLNTLELSNMTAVGGALYVRAKQGGTTNATPQAHLIWIKQTKQTFIAINSASKRQPRERLESSP